MSGASEHIVRALAFSAATVVAGGGVDSSQSTTFTTPLPPSEVEKALGIEEPVPVVECDFLDWFKEIVIIPGTDITLRFLHKPQMVLHCGGCVEIPLWGVRIPLKGISADSVRLAVVKTFLQLHRASQIGALSSEERKSWKSLVSDVDYAAYCEQTAPPVWSIGTKVKTTDKGVEVAWSSSDHEMLTGKFAEQMSVVEDGERFSALTSFVDYKLASLSSVAQLAHYSVTEDDLSWLS